MCPVRLFLMYKSKLPPTREELWLKPKKKNVLMDADLWYDKQVIGAHPLDNFMKLISERAGLSKIYTNHCIRSTVITSLDEKGFEARHITAVSGHKSENTIKSYSVKCPDSKKREMCDALSTKLGKPAPPSPFNEPPIKKSKQTSTVSIPDNDNNDTLNTINNMDLVDWIPIDNNADDFDLGEIISHVEQVEKEYEQSQRQVIPTSKTDTDMTEKTKGVNTVIQNFTSNTSANAYPPMPKMYFPNSSVTINYNFYK